MENTHAEMIEGTSGRDVENFFRQHGFDVEFLGEREGLLVLTSPRK